MTRYCDKITGTWCIYANYPVIKQPALPKRIRWNYEGFPPNTMEADRYELTQSLGGTLPIGYRLSYRYNRTNRSSIDATTTTLPGPINYSQLNLIYVGYSKSQVQVKVGPTQVWSSIATVDSNDPLQYSSFVIYRVTPYPAYPADPKPWTLKLFQNNGLIYTETNNTKPQISELEATPLICEHMNEWILEKKWDNVFPDGFLQKVGNGTNTSSITLQFWNGEPETGALPVNVIDLTSEAGCPPPLVSVDCGCEQCPPDTCQVLDERNNKILCVDKMTGCTVKEIDYNSKCHTYEGIVCI